MRRLILLTTGFGHTRLAQRFEETGFDVILCSGLPVGALSHLRTKYDHITFIGESSYQEGIDSYILYSPNDNLPSYIPALTVSGWWRWLLFSERVFLELWGWLTYKVFDEVGFDEPIGYQSKLRGLNV